MPSISRFEVVENCHPCSHQPMGGRDVASPSRVSCDSRESGGVSSGRGDGDGVDLSISCFV